MFDKNHLTKVFNEYLIEYEKLSKICDKVAKGLGYQYSCEIEFIQDDILFYGVDRWYENTLYSFPADLLENIKDENDVLKIVYFINNKLKEKELKRLEEEKKKKEEQELINKENRHKQYLKLKEEFS